MTTHKFQIGDYVANRVSLEQVQLDSNAFPACFRVCNQITYRSLDVDGHEHIERAYGLRSGQDADTTTRAFEEELVSWAEVVVAYQELQRKQRADRLQVKSVAEQELIEKFNAAVDRLLKSKREGTNP